jgi:tripartite-type tricarboxylate transporter receptor subunit TctC
MRLLKLWILLVAVVGALAPPAARAQWPEKPVRIVIPYVGGAMGDVVARLLSEGLRQQLGQPVIVENKPGAGGNIGTRAVVDAAPDGYTVVVGATNNFAINQFLYKDMGFDPLAALVPVTILVDVPSVIFINAQTPATTFGEFVGYARANRGKLNFGSPGGGTTPHLSAALISKTRDLGMTHVAYKGAAQAMTALLANDVQMYLVGAGIGLPHVKAGKLRAVAISAPKRLDALPDTPTFAEVGLSDIEASNYWVAAVPKGTPPAIVQKLYEAFRAVIASPEAQARFAALGVISVASTPADTAARLKRDAAYWEKAVRETGAQID